MLYGAFSLALKCLRCILIFSLCVCVFCVLPHMCCTPELALSSPFNVSCLPAGLPVFLPACQPACLPACLPARLPACLPACLPAWCYLCRSFAAVFDNGKLQIWDFRYHEQPFMKIVAHTKTARKRAFKTSGSVIHRFRKLGDSRCVGS